MKKIVVTLLAFCGVVQAQVFEGKGDKKFQIGANVQNGGRGIAISYDFGLGGNFSAGFATNYLLGVDTPFGTPKFNDRYDLKARFSANIADVIGIEEIVDVYPGLNVGLRNFGGHLGMRYFFTDGFGLYSEVHFPIAYYNTKQNAVNYDHLNNQFAFTIGVSFNL